MSPPLLSDWLRYERQMRLPEVGRAGQERLDDARVLLVGCGGLGAPAALYLAAAGVGQLVLADDDVVALSNLHRQVAYVEADIGQPKATALAARLRRANSGIQVTALQTRISAENAAALAAGADLIVDATDNLASRYALSDACVALGVPLAHASVHGFTGQLALLCVPFASDPSSPPLPNRTRGCYRCVHPVPPPPALVPACDAAGILGTTPGVLGALLAQEALKWLLGMPVPARLLTVDLRRLRWASTALQPQPNCAACSLQSLQIARKFVAEPLTQRVASELGNAGGAPAIEVSLVQALARIAAGADLWDVRGAAEWAAGNLAGLGARHVVLDSLAARIQLAREGGAQLPDDIVLYCEAGTRSRAGAEQLSRAGHRACSLRSGYAALR